MEKNNRRGGYFPPKNKHFTQLVCKTFLMQTPRLDQTRQASILDEVHFKANEIVALQAKKTLSTKQLGIPSVHRNMRLRQIV